MPKNSSSFIAFCPQKGEHAGRPGVPTNNVQLVAVRPGHFPVGEADPNGALFADSNGSVSVTLNGLTPVEAAKYSGGKKYEITIREIE